MSRRRDHQRRGLQAPLFQHRRYGSSSPCQHPVIAVWDDHESANNAFEDGAENHSEGSEGAWADREAAARQVYDEWMPLRESAIQRIYRALAFGDLVDLIMLDTRLHGRDLQAAGPVEQDVIDDPERSLLGFDQEMWLEEQLSASTARWRILGQQVMMTQFKAGTAVLNADGWDGYAPARSRLWAFVRAQEIANLVVLTGDIHSSWAADLVEDPNVRPSVETGVGALGLSL